MGRGHSAALPGCTDLHVLQCRQPTAALARSQSGTTTSGGSDVIPGAASDATVTLKGVLRPTFHRLPSSPCGLGTAPGISTHPYHARRAAGGCLRLERFSTPPSHLDFPGTP